MPIDAWRPVGKSVTDQIGDDATSLSDAFSKQLMNKQNLAAAQKLQETKGQQAQSLQDQEYANKDKLNAQEMQRNIGTAKDLRNLIQPGEAVTAGQGTVHFASKDPYPQQARLDLQTEKRHDNLVKSIQADFQNKAKGSQEALQSAKSSADALERGDITTLGQLKNNLPTLEGAKFRPTDQQRKDMMNQTATGTVDKLMNYFGGDNSQLNEAQRKGYAALIRQRAQEEEQRLGSLRGEVMQRYKHRISSMSPDEQADLASSLGMSHGELASQVLGQGGGAGAPSPQDLMQKIQALEAKKKAAGK